MTDLLRLFYCRSTHAVVDNLEILIKALPFLPRNLKARVLHLMSKRNNLLNDDTLPVVSLSNLNYLPS